MLVHMEIPGMSLNLQDPLLRLTGIPLRQTGGPLFCQILTDFARGGRRANSTPGPARGGCYILSFVVISPPIPEKKIFKGFYHIWAYVHDLGPSSRNDHDL